MKTIGYRKIYNVILGEVCDMMDQLITGPYDKECGKLYLGLCRAISDSEEIILGCELNELPDHIYQEAYNLLLDRLQEVVTARKVALL